MSRTVEVMAVFVLAASLALVGCSDRSPLDPFNDGSKPFFARPPAEGFDALRRGVPIVAELSVTSMVGPEGAVLEIPEAGVTFVVPAFALSEPTEITMTAVAGDAMAVEFAPHGLEFAVPASIGFQARGTHAEDEISGRVDGEELESFLGVYFEGDPAFGVEPLENIATHLQEGAIVFLVGHFSGYVVATG